MSTSEIVKKGVQRDSFMANLLRDGEVYKLRYGADKVYDLTLDYPESEPPASFNQELKNLYTAPPGRITPLYGKCRLYRHPDRYRQLLEARNRAQL